MKTIRINAYKYQELNQDSRNRVKNWLDELPYPYEEEDNKGNIHCHLADFDKSSI